MDKHKGKADSKACKVAGTLLGVGGAENYEDEEECGYALDDEGTPGTTGICNTVSSEPCRISHCAGGSGEGDDAEEDGCAGDTAEDLTAPVAAGILPGHTFAKHDSKGDGGIDVATGDATDSVGHGNDRKTECESCCSYACRLTATNEHGGSATQKGENGGADKFCKILFHNNKRFWWC